MARRIPPIVRVTWFDAHSIDEWTDHEDLNHASRLPLIESAGYLVLDKKDRIGLAACFDPDTDGPGSACVIVIPRGMLADAPVEVAPARELPDEED